MLWLINGEKMTNYLVEVLVERPRGFITHAHTEIVSALTKEGAITQGYEWARANNYDRRYLKINAYERSNTKQYS